MAGDYVFAAGRADVNDIDLFLADHLGKIVVQRRILQFVFRQPLLSALDIFIAARHQLCILHLRKNPAMPASDNPNPNDRVSPLLGHEINSL